MRTRGAANLVWALAVAVGTAASLTWVGAQGGAVVAIDPDDIGGTVTSANGPEAGVWVIAETNSLPTKFVRIVATDDQGRYVLPDLPAGDYEVFVRGYGLVDSPRQTAKPGQHLDLEGRVAPTPSAAAEYYPAAYWLALMKEAPPESVSGCLACHEIGNKGTREIPTSIVGQATSSVDAWMQRVYVGPEGPSMRSFFNRLGPDVHQLFADWTDGVANGDIPREVPPRPAGVERNVVISLWDWGTKYDGRTDAVASYAHDATHNANGKVYMVSRTNDVFAILDPVAHRVQQLTVPSNAQLRYTQTPSSPYWGDEPVWQRRAEPRSTAFGRDGRVWLTGILRERSERPAFCNSESNRFASYYPGGGGDGRQLLLFDSQSEAFTQIPDVCGNLDHNHFGPDEVLYFGGGNDTIWWLDVPTWDETHDAEASQGWCPAVVDTNADGLITEWTEPDEPADLSLDRRVAFGCYQPGVDENDPNGVVWCGNNESLTRIERGSNAPQSCRAEVYRPPTEVSGSGHAAIDENGVVWMIWRGSQHLTSFDRRKCEVTDGPGAATGDNCAEGWSVYRLDGPTYPNSDVQSLMTYLPQIDIQNTLGLGRNVPVYGTVNTDMLTAFVPETTEFVKLIVPYPMGFFSRSANGRIDDPNAGWKGRGLWSSFSSYTPWHVESGKQGPGPSTDGHGSHAVKFQVRPNPLAK